MGVSRIHYLLRMWVKLIATNKRQPTYIKRLSHYPRSFRANNVNIMTTDVLIYGSTKPSASMMPYMWSWDALILHETDSKEVM